MFWQFDTGFVSQLDTILDKEDVSLQELMDEEDILQECKSQNQKLIDFITRPAILEELINLITNEPPIELNEKIRFKYANIACEILTCDVGAVSDALVSNETLLNKLYYFIEPEKELNPLLASFYSKLMGLLFAKRTEIVFESYKNKDFIGLLINHIQTSAIMDLILKLIINVDNIDLRVAIVKWLHDNNLIGRLVALFKTNNDPQCHINAAQLLCDIIKTSREHQSLLQEKAERDLLLETIESSETVSELLENMFTCRHESVLVSGISVLQSLLEYKRHCLSISIQQLPANHSNIHQPSEFEGIPQAYAQQILGRTDALGSDQMTPLDAERLAKGVRQVQEAIIPRLYDFTNLLTNPPTSNPIKTTVGVIEKPLGATRLEVAHLITALLSSNNSNVIEGFAGLKTLPVLIDLFFEYPWNNFLHKQVEQTIVCMLNNNIANSSSNSPVTQEPNSDQMTSSSKFSSVLLVKLLTECHLIERIIDSWKLYCPSAAANDDTKVGQNRPQNRPGFMGHLTNIANSIVDKCDVQLLQENLSSELLENWNNFVKNSLSEINKQICTPLVNELPNATNMGEDSLRQQESALQQAFIEYQMQQMTRNLCTQIAFAAHDFTEVNDNLPQQVDQLSKMNFNFENQMHDSDKTSDFEKMCAERAKANIDNNSSDEEDLWEDRDLTFTQSSIATQKKSELLFSEEASLFSHSNFNLGNTGDIRITSMEVDQNDPWGSGNTSSSTSGPVPMDTSNPWDAMKNKSQNLEGSVEADSWADFSNFASSDFNASIISSSHKSSFVTTSSCPTLSSSESHTLSCDIPESTTAEETVSHVASTNVSDLSYSSIISESQKIISEEQENIVSSSTSDSVQNGPS